MKGTKYEHIVIFMYLLLVSIIFTGIALSGNKTEIKYTDNNAIPQYDTEKMVTNRSL